MFFKKWTSPNFEDRIDDTRPSLIILHYTGMKTAAEALARLCDPASKVSAHYVVEETGKIHALVDDVNRAWHAGKSYWAGERDVNSHSIGIEIVNPGHEFGYRAFPEAQIAAVVKLCKKLMKRHGIAPVNILAHSDVAPERKIDPGELFPWREMAGAGVGFWPEPLAMDHDAVEDVLRGQGVFLELLWQVGYDPEAGEAAVIRAFHRHFYPEKFKDGEEPDAPDSLSAARLLALVRARDVL
ncbi:MAG: N-acetylmuramoyl-L-alanine amidase [Alphaproteobacteria bacterium]